MTEVSLLRKKEETALSVECVKESMRRFFAAYEYVLGSFLSRGRCDRFIRYDVSTLGT
jgi:hypothetical protein